MRTIVTSTPRTDALRGTRAAPSARRGVTLMEVMLTLAVLVLLVSIAWPTLDRSFENQRLKKAGDLIRAEWTRARVRAMSTGYVHIFQYTVGGNEFATHRRVASEVEVSDVAGFGEAVLETPDPFGAEAQLPEGVTFVGSQTALDTRAERFRADPAQFRSPDQGWSEPIFFYADGTTSTARLVLRNERGRTLDLALRGLTGVVTVGDVRAPEDAGLREEGGLREEVRP